MSDFFCYVKFNFKEKNLSTVIKHSKRKFMSIHYPLLGRLDDRQLSSCPFE